MGDPMRNPSSPDGESPVFRTLNDVVRREFPSALYERDLFLHAINDTRLQMRARNFSRDILGGYGEVRITNRDYRSLLGVLTSSFVLLKDEHARPSNVVMSALETYEKGCEPGADALAGRIQSLMEYAPDNICCSVRRRVRDIIRLLEVSYPLGTSVTDPDGGPDAVIPAERHVSLHAYVNSVEEQVRMQPIRGKTEISSTQKYKRAILSQRTDLEEGDVARIGRDQTIASFFGVRSEDKLILQPEVDLGSSCFPGTWLVVRHADHVAVMIKNVLCYAGPKSADTSVAEGDLAVKTRSSHAIDREYPVSVLSIAKRDEHGGFDPEHPDVRYEFFDVSDKSPMAPFGKTVRKERASAQ